MEQFSVMSFNVRGDFTERKVERRWITRADLNTRTIRRYTPDIIGFQEIQSANVAHYGDHLTEYEYTVGRDKGAGKWVLYNPIYYKTRRWACVDNGGFFLSETPNVWSKGWDAAFVRGATWARLQSKTSGAEVLHINAHFDHIGEKSRVESARLIVSMAERVSGGLPVILTADFNSRAWAPDDESSIHYPPSVHRDKLPPGGTVYSVFEEAGFRDTYIESGHHNQLNMNTFHGFMGEDFPPCALRIDWILIRDGEQSRIETENFHILRDSEPPIYPSDHYPIMAQLSLT